MAKLLTEQKPFWVVVDSGREAKDVVTTFTQRITAPVKLYGFLEDWPDGPTDDLSVDKFNKKANTGEIKSF